MVHEPFVPSISFPISLSILLNCKSAEYMLAHLLLSEPKFDVLCTFGSRLPAVSTLPNEPVDDSELLTFPTNVA